MIAGVLTASELALLRTRPQRTQLYLAIPAYNTVYTARVNGTPATNDNTRQIIYDGGAGTLANVAQDMLLMVGTTAGGWDIGMARIRKAPSATLFYIGSTSELDLSDDQYITIVDDFALWPKHPYITTGGTVYMDYDVAYTAQNVYGPPVPILSSHVVLELTGASVTANFDASGSYSCIGTPSSYSYAWYVDGVNVANTATTTITFTSAGTYLIKLEVTAHYVGSAGGTESVAYRYVIVHDQAHPLNSSFTLESCSGDFESGNWSYRVMMNAKASEAYVRDRTLCLLVAKDWYGDTQQSIGPLSGRENIICAGWVDGESLRRSNDKSMVSFEVQGPAFWLGMQDGFPTGIDDTNVAPTDWSHIQALDPRKGLFSFLHWRTTATVVTDCYITSDDHRLATTYTPAGSLLEQLRAIAERVNAHTVCDRYGRLFCEIDTQFISPVSRTFPVVQTLSDRDWRDEITIERRTAPQCGQVDLSGVYYSGDLTTSNAIFSLSPGHYPKHYGEKRKVERIALDDQAEANTLAGLWAGYLNNEYPNIDTPMSSNYRAVDIAPRMFAQMNLAAGDTPRGLIWTNKKLIPREVSFEYDTREALLLTDITFESETFASDAVTGDPPIEPPDPPPPPEPPTLCNDPLALNFGGYAPCIYPPTVDLVIAFTATQLGRSADFYTATSPTWENIKVGNLAGVNVGTILNCAVAPDGTAWVLTYNDEATLGDNGTFYCPDITVAAPAWSLIQSITDYRTATGTTGYPKALSVDSTNVFHIQSDGDSDYGYGTSTVTWVTPGGAAATRKCINTQYSVGVVAGSVRGGHSPSPTPGKLILSMAGAANSIVLYSTVISDPISVAGNHALSHPGGNTATLFHYTDTPVLDASTITNIYADANWETGVISDGTNVLTTRHPDNYLMLSAVAIATPLQAFGAGRTGGAFCFGAAGYGEVIWLAQDAGALTAFISLRDTSGGWTDKTGNWVAILGAWAGTVSGVIPTPMTVSI